MQLLKRVKWVYVLLSLFLIGVGVCLCLWPDIPSVTICCAIGGGAVLFGIVKIVLYFLNDIEQVGEQNDFAIGAICVIAGAILLIHPGAVLATVGLRGPVDYTVVGGKVVVKEGRLVNVDEAALAEAAGRCCADYLARA